MWNFKELSVFTVLFMLFNALMLPVAQAEECKDTSGVVLSSLSIPFLSSATKKAMLASRSPAIGGLV